MQLNSGCGLFVPKVPNALQCLHKLMQQYCCCLYLHHLAQNECPHQTKLLCSVYSLFNHCCLFRQCFCSKEVSRSLINSKFSTSTSRCRCFVPGDMKGGQMSIPATGYASLKPDSGNFAPYILHCKVERAIFKQNTICL